MVPAGVRTRCRPRLAAMDTTPANPMTSNPASPAEPGAGPPLPRPRAAGKFLLAGGEKLHVRGVTYGTFRPLPDGDEFPEPEAVDRDFRLMAEQGINAVRTYTPPPTWLLDLAARHGLR